MTIKALMSMWQRSFGGAGLTAMPGNAGRRKRKGNRKDEEEKKDIAQGDAFIPRILRVDHALGKRISRGGSYRSAVEPRWSR
jgi:hypothetical protein